MRGVDSCRAAARAQPVVAPPTASRGHARVVGYAVRSGQLHAKGRPMGMHAPMPPRPPPTRSASQPRPSWRIAAAVLFNVCRGGAQGPPPGTVGEVSGWGRARHCERRWPPPARRACRAAAATLADKIKQLWPGVWRAPHADVGGGTCVQWGSAHAGGARPVASSGAGHDFATCGESGARSRARCCGQCMLRGPACFARTRPGQAYCRGRAGRR